MCLTSRDPALRMVLDELLENLARSIDKHGRWDDYGEDEIFEAVTGEWDEFREAFLSGDVDGDHGQISELMDLAVTALKGVVRLRNMVGDRRNGRMEQR